MTINDGIDPSSPQACGRRIKYIRDELLGLSRNKFAEKHKNKSITKDALNNWEEARYKGLKIHHLEILIKAFEEEGVIVDRSWLLNGIGEIPKLRTYLDKSLKESVGSKAAMVQERSEDEAIAAELRTFRENHLDAVDAIIADNAMAPFYLPGDYVAGIRYIGANIENAIGLPCIIQTQSGQVVVRKLDLGTMKDHFNLVGFEQNPTRDKYRINDIRLFSAAPIIWIRKPLAYLKR